MVEVDIEPTLPVFNELTIVVSSIASVELRDKSDFDGRVDWEKGVVGDVRPAATFDSFAPFAKEVASVGMAPFRVASCGAE
jgi:hypothetical protein